MNVISVVASAKLSALTLGFLRRAMKNAAMTIATATNMIGIAIAAAFVVELEPI